jgi:hypothetical protein
MIGNVSRRAAETKSEPRRVHGLVQRPENLCASLADEACRALASAACGREPHCSDATRYVAEGQRCRRRVSNRCLPGRDEDGGHEHQAGIVAGARAGAFVMHDEEAVVVTRQRRCDVGKNDRQAAAGEKL